MSAIAPFLRPVRQDIAAICHPADALAAAGKAALGEGGGKIGEQQNRPMPAGSPRLRRFGKWHLLADGEHRLSVHSPVKPSARPLVSWSRLPVFWRVQFAGWGLFAIVDLISQRLIFHDFAVASLRTALIVACLFAISSGMRSVYASRPLDNRLTWRAGGWMVLLSVGGAALVAGLVFAGRELGGWRIPGRDAVDEFFLPLINCSFALVGWSLCYFWIHAELAEQAEHRHAVRAEAEALRAELEELRLQLDPHFLFNALNGVAEEIPDHPAAALAMLRDLTAYLRHSLDGINQTVVTVEAELGGLAAYLRVQQARFGDRLKVVLQADPAARERRIASFLLQPLVENAVKHGRRESGLEVSVDVRVMGQALRVVIENTGALESAAKPRRRRSGVGLENVRRRLALHYPGRHQFTLGEQAGTTPKVVATLVLEGEPCGS
jgi:signal transduction histidine kinase